jgi:magnesium transporter
VRRLFERSAPKAGQPPGTLSPVAEDAPTRPPRITVIDYTADRVEEREVASVEECLPYRESNTVTWINVDGIHHAPTVQALGEHFGLHPLLLEDVMHPAQRPKLEDFGDYAYIVVRMLYDPDPEDDVFAVDDEQISIILGPQWVITFQEDPGDVWDTIRQRIRAGHGRVRSAGADYLAYALLDVVVDNYFAILERFGDELEEIDAEVMREPSHETYREIRDVKRALIQIRRWIWPLRDVFNVLLRGETRLFKKATLVFVRDAYDHTIRAIDMVETFRELVAGITEMYMSAVSHRLNEVMKVLTIIATVFIPLTFIAGVYGMNFDNMPELHWRYGYWFVWGVMVATAGVLILYFRRRRWL